MQTLRHKSALRLANRERRGCGPASAQQSAQRADSVGALGAARAFVARSGDALESVRSAIREKLRM
jgi:hypothetical protein